MPQNMVELSQAEQPDPLVPAIDILGQEMAAEQKNSLIRNSMCPLIGQNLGTPKSADSRIARYSPGEWSKKNHPPERKI